MLYKTVYQGKFLYAVIDYSIGEGGQGTVWAVSQDTCMALNQLKPVARELVAKIRHDGDTQTTQSDIRVQLKLLEIDPIGHYHWPVVAFLYHPFVTSIQDTNQDQLVGYMMAKAEGDLDTVFKQQLYPMNTIHDACRQVLIALAYIHDRKMAHGDVNAKNVLISEGRARLSDCWGIDLSTNIKEPFPPTTFKNLPPSFYHHLDQTDPHTWVHVDKFGWVKMVLGQLRTDQDTPSVETGHELIRHIDSFASHPLWPDVVPIMNRELEHQDDPKRLSVEAHVAITHGVCQMILTVQNTWSELSAVIKRD